MKTYKIIKPILLSFIGRQDQYDVKAMPGSCTLEWDEKYTIWAVNFEGRRETINTTTILVDYLKDGSIVEL
jgi:hypothetical protein